MHSRFWEQASATADFEHPEIKWEHSSVGSEHPELKKREGPWFLKILKIKNGSIAQLVQSICLTSRGSLVRIQVFPQVDSKFAILFCLMGSAQLV